MITLSSLITDRQGASMNDKERNKLEQQWRTANERVNRWANNSGIRVARYLREIEDKRMQKIEKKLGYIPTP